MEIKYEKGIDGYIEQIGFTRKQKTKLMIRQCRHVMLDCLLVL